MSNLKAYTIIKPHFGPERPGGQHAMRKVGSTIFAPLEGPGALPPKQDYAKLAEEPKAAPPAQDRLTAAQARVAAARKALKAADKKGDADKIAEAQAEVTAAESELAAPPADDETQLEE